jgi:hypothetical protein
MPSPSTDTHLTLDPATRQAIALLALYLLLTLGGVLAFAHQARFARLGLGISLAAGGLLLLTTVARVPMLLPI